MSSPLPRLILITDWEMGERALLEAVEDLLPLGRAVAIQHRHPGAEGGQLLREARLLAARCERFGVPLFVNERLDVALVVGAHLHLPARGPDVSDVRPLLPEGTWISVAAPSGKSVSASPMPSSFTRSAIPSSRASRHVRIASSAV